MKVRVLFVCALAVCLFQAMLGQQPTTATPQGYLLGPGDVISVRVLGEEQFNVEKATIDDDGKIQIPYAEDGLTVKCKTEKDLRAEIVKLYSRMLRNPQVTVNVVERKSRPPVSVSGEVKKPGLVELRRASSTRLIELINFSEGVTEDSNGMIQVFRTQLPMCSDKEAEKEWNEATNNGLEVPSRMYSMSNLLKGSDEANPIIFPGDVIVAQKASPVYITGEVLTPQGVYLKEGGISLKQAVAMVGGVKPEAKTKIVKIYRLKPNSKDREVISVNYELINKGTQKDVMLEPYDIVEVDKAKDNMAQTILKMAIGIGKTVVTSGASSLSYRVLY